MGDSYNSFQNNVNVSSDGIVGGSVITVFNYVWDIWSFSTLFFGIFYFKKLRLQQKCIAVACISLEIIFYLSRGTNIGIFRIVLIFLTIYYIEYLKLKKNGTRKNTFFQFRGNTIPKEGGHLPGRCAVSPDKEEQRLDERLPL